MDSTTVVMSCKVTQCISIVIANTMYTPCSACMPDGSEEMTLCYIGSRNLSEMHGIVFYRCGSQ